MLFGLTYLELPNLDETWDTKDMGDMKLDLTLPSKQSTYGNCKAMQIVPSLNIVDRFVLK